MKFQDDISNMNTYIRTYIHTDKPKPICPPPPLFQSWGHKNGMHCKLDISIPSLCIALYKARVLKRGRGEGKPRN